VGRVHIVGHTHIDAAWLWRWTETVKVCKESFSKVLKVMEKYPQFKFAQSSAHYYLWMEERFPEIFDSIAKNVKRGAWEPTLPWVEFDANLSSGEAIIRHLVYAKRYFREKLGYDPKVLWLPDTFGFPITLPQLMRSCDVRYFLTQKLRWNDTTVFPYHCFWWESPDGSRVLAYQTPGSYSGYINEEVINRELMLSIFRQEIDTIYHLIGYGDHGGGVTEDMVKEALKYIENHAHEALFSTPNDFFKELERISSERGLPVWKDELYLQYHRGTYTTQAKIKKLNRLAERLLIEGEKLASLAAIEKGVSYPYRRLKELWIKLLFNQFHDILAGSSIPEVYEDSVRDLREVIEGASAIIVDSLKGLSKGVKVKGTGLMVFNTLPWRRHEVIELDTKVESIEDLNGKALLTQKTERGLMFIAEDLPPIGYKVFKFSSKRNNDELNGGVNIIEEDEKIVLENDSLKAEIEKKTGLLKGLYLKGSNTNLINSSEGVKLQVFEDKPVIGRQTLEERFDAKLFDAWEIYIFQQSSGVKKRDLTNPLELSIIERGPVRGIVRVKYIYKQEERPDSIFEVSYCVYHKIPWLEIKVKVSWNAKHRMLKLLIPTSFISEYVKFDQPYGWIMRRSPLSPEASLSERAKWEVPGQLWAEIRSNGELGLSVIDRGIYGYDFGNNYIRLSLLRSPEYPKPYSGEEPKEKVTDQGVHEFEIAIYPHRREYKLIDTIRKAYEYNYQALPIILKDQEGEVIHERSFLNLKGEVILTAFKRCETDENCYILRLHEPEGIDKVVELSYNKIRKAYEVNSLEEELREVNSSKDGRLKINIPGFKVYSLKFSCI